LIRIWLLSWVKVTPRVKPMKGRKKKKKGKSRRKMKRRVRM